MKIALYGIGGLYNYGCEAIVRGTVTLIRSIVPEAEIIYFSKRADEDKKVISDLNIEVIQLRTGRSLFSRILNKLLKCINIPYRFGLRDHTQIIELSDVIFSIGGDIYTIPEYIRRNKRYSYYRSLVQLGERALKKNKILIIYGASIGPFGKYRKAQKYFFNHLKKVDLIAAREQKCVEYLYVNGIKKNVCFIPDPAFAVSLKQDVDDIPEFIGINLSPLSVNELYGHVSDDIIVKFAKHIEAIVIETGFDVLLIPHVISPVTELDNDLLFLNSIFNRLDDSVIERVKLCKPSNFLEAKRIVRLCRIVISARMHCAINAICEGVPTLFLSYSEKAKGMSKFVYGNDRFNIPLQDFDYDITEKIEYILENENEIRNFLKDRVGQIQELMLQEEHIGRIRDLLDANKK